jgi:hypothetical protein
MGQHFARGYPAGAGRSTAVTDRSIDDCSLYLTFERSGGMPAPLMSGQELTTAAIALRITAACLISGLPDFRRSIGV